MPCNLLFIKAGFDYPCWVATDDAVGRHVMGDHTAGGYNRTSSNRNASNNDGTVSNPDVILYYNLGRVATRRIPNGLADYVVAVIVAPHKSNVSRDQNHIAEPRIAMHDTVGPKLHLITQLDVMVRRP
jgi:hypothetical protein